jgi:hypothetical protein
MGAFAANQGSRPNRTGTTTGTSIPEGNGWTEEDWMKYINDLMSQSSEEYGAELPQFEQYDPMEYAQQMAEWEKTQRVNSVNSMIDNILQELGLEEGRVSPYYEKLLANLGVTREAALSGSDAMQQGIDTNFTENSLGLSDAKQKAQDEAMQMLAATGTLDSGKRDRAMRDINSMYSNALTGIMKGKDTTLNDLLSGKKATQEVYTQGIKDADTEKMSYLKELATRRSGYETQRGQEILNASNEANASVPIYARQFGQDQFSANMQRAMEAFNQKMQTSQFNLNKMSTLANMASQGMGARGGYGYGSSGGMTADQLFDNNLNMMKYRNELSQQDMQNSRYQNEGLQNFIQGIWGSPDIFAQMGQNPQMVDYFTQQFGVNPFQYAPQQQQSASQGGFLNNFMLGAKNMGGLFSSLFGR